jgi:hypothetical protein
MQLNRRVLGGLVASWVFHHVAAQTIVVDGEQTGTFAHVTLVQVS